MIDPRQVSLIVATYNWPEALELVLLGLKYQTRQPKEVIIADDGSTDDTRKLIDFYKGHFPVPLHHHWHADEGFRKTIILNKAVKSAQGNYIIQIDGDVIPDRHFIEDHLKVAEKGCFIRGTRAHLNPAATQKAIDNKQYRFHCWSPGVRHRNNAVRSMFLLPLGIKKSATSHSVRGSNFAYWKAPFLEVNGYNNALTGWGHEDEELAARLVNLGIFKKKVKLAAIQYHLYHNIAAQDRENLHSAILREVREKRILKCLNGIAQV